MLLQSLVACYEDLVAKGKLPRPGWGTVKVSYALYIDDNGNLTGAASVKTEQQRGKKTQLMPQEMAVPAPTKRSVNIAANFLCDNSGYMLGVDTKGKPERAKECFENCKALHHLLLDGLDDPAARALLNFFDNWQPEQAAAHSALRDVLDELISGVNIVFRYGACYLHEIPAIAERWTQHYLSASGGEQGVCLVTGQKAPVEAIHPAIKGIRGAQSSGAALVSFNAESFTSYGKEQNYNAPVSQYAAFAYTTALNYLIADRDHVHYVGDTAVICWAKGCEEAYQDFLGLNLLDQSEKYTSQEIRDKVAALSMGKPVEFEDTKLDPGRPFFVLGLAPNAARLSVRIFLRDSFGAFIENVAEHHQRLEITHSPKDPFQLLPMWKLLSETVNQKSKDKTPSPQMSGDVMRAILLNQRYPASLLNGVSLRIRADHEITRGRAAIIKAYYLKNPHPDVPKEVLHVSLNTNSTNVPYNLGRLFSVLENIQMKANPGINSTIRDKYFNAASATPGTIFPVLINLAQKHLRKIGGGLRVILERDLTGLLGLLGEEFPQRLNLAQQGAFQLGYYQQTQARYQASKEKED